VKSLLEEAGEPRDEGQDIVFHPASMIGSVNNTATSPIMDAYLSTTSVYVLTGMAIHH
jgi:hypothetical protein